MKKIIFVLSFFLFLNANAQPPTFSWVKGFNGNAYCHSVVNDASGNVFSFGEFFGTVDFNPPFSGPWLLTANGNLRDLFVTKHSPTGNIIWVQQIDHGDSEAGKEIAIDAIGNTYVTGDFQNTTTPTPFMAYVSKLDPNGNVLWNNIIQRVGLNGASAGLEIDIDASGNSYLVGEIRDTIDLDPGPGTFTLGTNGSTESFILKLNTSGNFVWAKKIGAILSSLSSDNSGNTYCTGQFYGTVDFDPGPGTFTLSAPTSSVSACLIKLDPLGNFVWAKQIDFAIGMESQMDKTNLQLYHSGVFTGTSDFDPGSSSYPLAASNGSVFISKLDANGNFIWAEQYSAMRPQSITIDALGNPYLSGYFSSTVDIDPGPITYTLADQGNADGYILKLDINGNFIWAAQIAGTTWESAENISVDASGNVFSVGMCDNNTDYDPGPSIVNSFWLYTYILKLGPPPLYIKENFSQKTLAYPNPFHDKFEIISSKNISNFDIKIYDLFGKVVYSTSSIQSEKISIDLSIHSSGIYFVEINTDGESYRTKIVKE